MGTNNKKINNKLTELINKEFGNLIIYYMKNDDDDHNENIKEIFKNIKERFKFLINITTGGFIMPPDNNYKTIITCDNFNTNIELLQESIHKLVSEKKLDECIKLLWDLYFQIKKNVIDNNSLIIKIVEYRKNNKIGDKITKKKKISQNELEEINKTFYLIYSNIIDIIINFIILPYNSNELFTIITNDINEKINHQIGNKINLLNDIKINFIEILKIFKSLGIDNDILFEQLHEAIHNNGSDLNKNILIDIISIIYKKIDNDNDEQINKIIEYFINIWSIIINNQEIEDIVIDDDDDDKKIINSYFNILLKLLKFYKEPDAQEEDINVEYKDVEYKDICNFIKSNIIDKLYFIFKKLFLNYNNNLEKKIDINKICKTIIQCNDLNNHNNNKLIEILKIYINKLIEKIPEIQKLTITSEIINVAEVEPEKNEQVQIQIIPQVKEQNRIQKIKNKVIQRGRDALQRGKDALQRGKNWVLSGFSTIGGNNTDYIYYKLKNKIYKRKIRYDKNNNEYVIINKKVYYI